MRQGFVCGLQDWSLCFLQSCGSLVIKSHWPSRSDTLGIRGLSDPQAGKPEVGLRTFPQWQNFFGIIFLQFVAHLAGMGFDRDCAPPTVLLWLLVFGCGDSFFGRFQYPPVNGRSSASCDFGVLSDECMSYFAILTPHLF